MSALMSCPGVTVIVTQASESAMAATIGAPNCAFAIQFARINDSQDTRSAAFNAKRIVLSSTHRNDEPLQPCNASDIQSLRLERCPSRTL
jgi:hypothetical protein